MPLHESPLQRCGSDHWLTEPCPRSECALMVFESGRLAPKVSRLEVAKSAVEEAVQREALTAAERQKRYRERQKLKRIE